MCVFGDDQSSAASNAVTNLLGDRLVPTCALIADPNSIFLSISMLQRRTLKHYGL